MPESLLAASLHNKIDGLRRAGLKLVRIELPYEDAITLVGDPRHTMETPRLFEYVPLEIFYGETFDPVVIWSYAGKLYRCQLFSGREDSTDTPEGLSEADTDDPGEPLPDPSEFRLNIPGLINIHINLPGL